jgi:hypothetical protein
LTGYEDISDQIVGLFQILAMLEIQAQAYLECDLSATAAALGTVPDVASGQRDRLVPYLSLL